MSKKSLLMLIVAVFVTSLGLSVTMSLAGNGPAEITLNADGKKPAVFPHATHQAKNDCATCHHKNVDGKQAPLAEGDAVEKCATCHNADFANEKLRTDKDVGHGLCKTCHKKMKDAGAPTKCTGCHVKK
jgi:predicted CXXCH cytochrome family protein